MQGRALEDRVAAVDAQGSPGGGPDGTVSGQAVRTLEALYGAVRTWSENAVGPDMKLVLQEDD